MADAVMPAELATSILGARLGWFLARLRDGAAGLSDEDLAAAWACEPPAAPARIRRGVLAHFASAIGPFSALGYERHDDAFAVAHLEDARRRRWRAWVQLEPDVRARIRVAASVLTAPPGYVVRPARAEDAAALRALERRCPIVSGGTRITYDRGADYFAGARLSGGITGTVAERDGEIVAMHCMLTHELRLAGAHLRATYLHHSRIAPDAQGAGLFSVLNGAELERHAREGDMFYSYVAVGNDAGQRVVPVPPWSIRPERLVIDCRAQAGAPHGRPARADDATRVASLVNLAHEREEAFVPYTVEHLTARVGREPASYGWPHLLLGDAAVVGVWPAGIRLVRETSDGCDESVRALVLDTGFAPGAEEELVALVRAWCTTLSRRGFTHLTLFTSPGSPARDALLPLAAAVEQYRFNIGLPEPSDVAARGLYVDQLFF